MSGVHPVAATGSLAAVLDAFRAGASTTGGLARATGLDRDLVSVALDQLVGLGLVDRSTVSAACPEGGCGGCALPTGHGCDSSDLMRPRGLVTLTLSHRSS